ncbi:hypothetical protein [Roseovarius mucosus]|uniref:hypothetical protein n=1 Tax=Roseovarius mucosus TaxID=215743 RepID=UPI003BA98A13
MPQHNLSVIGPRQLPMPGQFKPADRQRVFGWCTTGLEERLKGTFAQLKTTVWREKEGQRNHVMPNNVTPVDVDFVREKSILRERENFKTQTIRQRRLEHQIQAA